ncbi:MAG: pseudouridine synthase, partial [Fermentimonas sp.]|nr:pseudouridine synthase [Fermentimonas sp.]
MTTNNEESRPKRSFYSAHNERHASPNRNSQGNERRTQQEGYHSDRSYNQNRGERSQGSSYSENESGARKRRPRVGERVQSQQRGPSGGGYGNRSWGNQSQSSNYKTTSGGKKLKKKKPFKQIKYKE